MTHLSENDFCPIYKLVLTVGISWLLALIPTSKCSRNMAVIFNYYKKSINTQFSNTKYGFILTITNL